MMSRVRQCWHDAMRVVGRNDVPLYRAGGRIFGPRYVQLSLNARWLLQRAPVLLGWPGVVGIGLLIACSTFYFSTIQQAQNQLSSTRKHVQVLQSKLQRAEPNADRHGSEDQIVRFYQSFPQDKDLPRCMEKIFALAQNHGIELEQGEYKVTRESGNGLVRVQMTFPMKADYPQIRKYLSSLRTEMPTLSLQQVQFKRQQVGDVLVEANIKLVLFLMEQKS